MKSHRVGRKLPREAPALKVRSSLPYKSIG
jgi:hypothetical protein